MQNSQVTPATAPTQPRPLWNWKQYVEFLGVSERKAALMRAEGLLAEPLDLGPRVNRWIPAECEAAACSLPRRPKMVEPAQLARGRAAVKAAQPSVGA